MASLVDGILRAIRVNAQSPKAQGEFFDGTMKYYPQGYQPAKEAIAIVVKVGVAVGTYSLFNHVMSPKASLGRQVLTGVLAYRGFQHFMGEEPTDLAVAGWSLMQAYTGFTTSGEAKIKALGHVVMSIAMLFNTFALMKKNGKSASEGIDQFFCIPPTDFTQYSIWPSTRLFQEKPERR
jgi:hypothetical protein